MSQAGANSNTGSGAGSVETITGNSGGPVSPDGAFNIDILGNTSTGIDIVGTPASNLLTVIGIPASETQIGTVELATDAETIAGVDTVRSVVPSSLSAKLGSQTQHGVAIGNTTSGALNWTAVGSAGQVLTSNGAGIDPTFQAATGGVQTIDGDTGSATGSTITFDANSNCGSSVSFIASGSTVTLHVTNGSNTIIGKNSGNTGGTTNSSIGAATLSNIVAGANANTAAGYSSLNLLTTGSNNVAVGSNTLASLDTGVANTALGTSAGVSYTGSESSNILIRNQGTIGDSNIIRIGTQGNGAGEQDTCYIAGIASVSVSNTEMVTIDTTTGQLGSATIPSGDLSITFLDNTDSPYVVLSSDEYLSCDVSAGVLTIELPNNPTLGRVIRIKDSGGDANTSNISVTTVGGAVTIDGLTTYTMNTDYQAVSLIFNGGSYEVF